MLYHFGAQCFPAMCFFLHTLRGTLHACSNVEISNDFAEEQRSDPDPSIEGIFRDPKDQRKVVSGCKPSPGTDTGKLSDPSEELDKRVRVKRENLKRSNSKGSGQAAKSDQKRSASNKASKASSRSDRASKDRAKLLSKDSADYEASVDRSEYADEAEEDTAAGSKESKYKSGEFRVGEDSEGFIDQEERSSLYDDFEAKDVVKRGISGAEDYEEVNDEAAGVAEDTAALDERGSLDEEVEKKKDHGDARVKRQHEKGTPEEENVEAASDPAKDAEAPLQDAKKDAPVAEDQASKVGNDELADQSKRNVAEKQEKEEAKVSCEQETVSSKTPLNDQPGFERNENAVSLKEDGQGAKVDKKALEDVSLSSDKKATGLEASPKLDEPKVVEAPNPEAAKLGATVNGAETKASEDAGKLEGAGNSEATREQSDADYEKRVEEQIQRKIDSIKEQIKREIADTQRIKDIEENNAKFEELLDQEEEEQEQALEAEAAEKSEDLSKRSLKDSEKARLSSSAEKRLIRRRKRQDDNSQEKLRSAAERSLTVDKKPSRGVKRRAPKIEQAALFPRAASKPREVFLVRRDRSSRKKRRRRSKDSALTPDDARLRNTHPDAASNSNLRGDFSGGKPKSLPRVTEDEKEIAEQSSLAERKSGSVASLTANAEELGPLATEYGEAFGGLNAEPGVALARFKRIKRVLRPPASNIYRRDRRDASFPSVFTHGA
ncbi:uncharacterized protein LOC143373085 isoform X2 [Andrena cerasifolii]|uniref:uncharacterized protein LOC143373085 isoform X2 n=1 Tax=Andrena cerasifolii TaxID=2819439 RepID=UPI0040378A32